MVEGRESPGRRSDLDALRAFAMLLGIVLHGAISFVPGAGLIWGVQDSESSTAFTILMELIHGWRMPLFFLVSGFFTMMLWKSLFVGNQRILNCYVNRRYAWVVQSGGELGRHLAKIV